MHLSTISNRKTIGINFGKKDEKEKRMEWCAKNNRELQFRTKWSFFYVSTAELEEKKQLN